MNNSLVRPEPVVDEAQVKSKERESELVRKIEALQKIEKSQEWSTLKTEIFDGLAKNLERMILAEAKGENPNTNKLNRLTGELKWAARFADLSKYADELRVELKGIRLRIYGTKE